MGRGLDWSVEDTAQLRDWLHEGWTPREMLAMKKRRTREVLAKIETAVKEASR